MTTPTSKFPTLRRFFHPVGKIYRAVFTWRNARRALLGGAILVTLLVSFYLEELWRGQRAWEATRRDFEAKGGILDLAKLAPPPVPDDQNFAMTPLLKPLYLPGSQDHPNKYSSELWAKLAWPDAKGRDPDVHASFYLNWTVAKSVDLNDWQKFLGSSDILQTLKKFDPVLSEITAASRRPFARFPFEYENGPAAPPPGMDAWSQMMKTQEILRRLADIYEARALAELAAGQTDRAADDVVTIFQLAVFLNDESGMFTQLVSYFVAERGMQALWEGLAAHRWSDNQLISFSDELQKIDYLAGELRGVQHQIALDDKQWVRPFTDPTCLEGAFPWPPEGHWQGQKYDTISLLQQILEDHLRVWLCHQEAYWFPRGWLYQNRIIRVQDFQKILATFDVPHHRLDPEKSKALDDEFAQRKSTPFNFIANGMVYNNELTNLGNIFGSNQASLDEAQVACTLERFRLANDRLPETLAELAPKFITKIPTDIISGGPLHYQKKADGHFLLYEVGWNGTDDGGMVAKDNYGELDRNHGDWVWPDTPQG